MPRIALTMHPSDNVTTLMDGRLDQASTHDGLLLKTSVPFGHKVALRAIAAGEAVVKYGVTIGVATTAISPGEHVHVHNCS
ncbi:MAG: D-galactarate dehydratase [Betaproteobacteria bacterium]|nr:D-galactarate dehydratase [Betaproteobacteria bacterium]